MTNLMKPTPIVRVPPLVTHTPVEDWRADYGLLVKREDLCAPRPWPPFSKTRGVLGYMRKLVDEGQEVFGVLDTYHSQGGLAVSAAGAYLGARVINYFPVYQAERDLSVSGYWPKQLRWQQAAAQDLGAELIGLKAGRSAVLYHTAKADCFQRDGHMYPNALKLDESVEETAQEVHRALDGVSDAQYQFMSFSPWIVPASSGTLAAGVVRGLAEMFAVPPPVILHMGYSRSADAVMQYVRTKAGVPNAQLILVDEGYAYKDTAKAGVTPPWPCNEYYDLKALRWWMREGRAIHGQAVFWNIG